MIVALLTYKKPIEEVEKYTVAHRTYLGKLYAEGKIIVSGPRIPRTGGFILINTSKDEAQQIVINDPFHTNGIADYEVIEFNPVNYAPDFEHFIKGK